MPVKKAAHPAKNSTSSAKKSTIKKAKKQTKKTAVSSAQAKTPKPKTKPAVTLLDTSKRTRKFSILRSFADALNLIIRHPKPIFVMSFIYFLVIAIIAIVSNLISGKAPFALSFGFNFITPTWENMLMTIISLLVGVVFGIILTYYYNKLVEGRGDRSKTVSRSLSRLIPSILNNLAVTSIMIIVFTPFLILSLGTSIFAIQQAITHTDFNLLFEFLRQLHLSSAWEVFWTQVNPWLFLLSLAWVLIGIFCTLYVASRYFFSNQIVIITQARVGEAMSASSIITKGNALRIMLFQILLFFLYIAGGLFFGVGLLFIIPFVTISQLYAYHTLMGDLPRKK